MPVRSLDRMRISLWSGPEEAASVRRQERARERKTCVLAVRSRTTCREIQNDLTLWIYAPCVSLVYLTQVHGLVHVGGLAPRAPGLVGRRRCDAETTPAARPQETSRDTYLTTGTGTGRHRRAPCSGLPRRRRRDPVRDTFDTVASPERLNLARYAVRVHHVPAQRADTLRGRKAGIGGECVHGELAQRT